MYVKLARKEERLEALDLAHIIVDAVTDKLGENIILLDIQKLTPFADYFVICSGNSDRQLKAIMEGVDELVKKRFDINPRRVEGDGASGWILVDYSDVVLHIFTPRTRSFYDLESLWKEAPIVLRML